MSGEAANTNLLQFFILRDLFFASYNLLLHHGKSIKFSWYGLNTCLLLFFFPKETCFLSPDCNNYIFICICFITWNIFCIQYMNSLMNFHFSFVSYLKMIITIVIYVRSFGMERNLVGRGNILYMVKKVTA